MGKKATTIGFHYRWLLHFGWVRAADTLHRIEAGAKLVWTGCVHENTTITISAPDAWGGEKAEGGVEGQMDILFGGADQGANDYLEEVNGGPQTGNRHIVSTVYKGGRYGAFVPNPKPMAMLWECIHAMWPSGEAWYPDKAEIPLQGGTGGGGGGSPGGPGVPAEYVYNIGRRVVMDDPGLASAFGTLEMAEYYGIPYTTTDQAIWSWRPLESGLYYIKFSGEGDVAAAEELLSRGWQPNEAALMKFNDGALRMVVLTLTDEPPYAPVDDPWGETAVVAMTSVHGPVWMWRNVYGVLGLVAESAPPGEPGACAINAMNPAHMVYDALTHEEMQGEPTALIDEPSFMAAADALYLEGFGLCTLYDSDQESPWDFIQRLCNVVGMACSQSRVTGKYYLDLIRNDYVLEDLPVVTDAQIIDWKKDDTQPAEMVNSVQVKWTDVLKNEERTTAPLVALGNVRSIGEVIPQTSDYPEIPFESIALRAGKRDVDAKSKPLSRFTLTVQRKHRFLRPGQPFRLQTPIRGIADMVCRVGSISHGVHLDGRVRLIAVQDIFGLPATVNVSPITPVNDDTAPTAPAVSLAMEAPYLELAAVLTAEELAAVGEEAGYLMTGVSAPARGQNYAIYSKLPAEAYTRRAFGDFSPSATTFAASLPMDSEVQLVGGKLLDRVAAGSWAAWDDEIIRVDAISPTGLLSMSRGCADTVPAPHEAGSAILFLSDWAGTDGREYVEGDELMVKTPVSSGSAEQALADVTAHEVIYRQRQFRPLPPGALTINGEPFYAFSAVVPTAPGGGGGGTGGGGGPSSPPGVGPDGIPISTSPGPSGGFPDNAPYHIPQPTVFGTNLDPGGGVFGDPDLVLGWRKRDGSALPVTWDTATDALRFSGSGLAEAYDYALRLSFPTAVPGTKFIITFRATLETPPGVTAQIGIGRGFVTQGEAPADVAESMSPPLEYPIANEVEVTFEYVTVNTLIAVNVLPFVRFTPSTGYPYIGKLSLFDYQVTVVEPVMTDESPTNADLSAGLTGITQSPVAPGVSPSVVISAGELKATSITEFGQHQIFIWDDPITGVTDIGQVIEVGGDAWSNSVALQSGITVMGTAFGVAVKLPGAAYSIMAIGRPQRGDWTPRRYGVRVPIDPSTGATYHLVAETFAEEGKTSGFRDAYAKVSTTVVLP